MKKILIVATLALVLSATQACNKDEGNGGSGSSELPKLDIQNLREAPMPIGGAVLIDLLKTDAQYRELVIKEYSSVTAENAMKMDALSTGIGSYNWEDADYLVSFAQQNNMRVHGHTLLWYRTTPSWFSSFNGDRDAWIGIMKQYIQDVVGHFQGKVGSWDVVNEAVMDDGTLRPSVWLTKIGEEYISLAFQFAHEADPDAKLFYNEYGQEYSHAKHVAINNLVDKLVAAEVPIHGVGMQMHTDIFKQEDRLKYAIRAVSSRGLLVHVSELDVSTNPENNEEATFTDELAKKQQAIYRYVAQGMMEVPQNQRFGITFWGVTDQYSWRYENTDWVLPFDKNYKRKAAYDGLLEGLYK